LFIFLRSGFATFARISKERILLVNMKASLLTIAASAGVAAAWPRLPFAPTYTVVNADDGMTATAVPVNTLYAYQTVSPTTAAVATVYGIEKGSAAVATYYSAEGSSGLVQPTYIEHVFWAAPVRALVTTTV